MNVDAKNVLTGAPDQATTGAISSALLILTPPTSVAGPFDAAFASTGYVNEDGLTFNAERSTESIKDWSGAIVRQVLSEFNGKFSWAHLETNVESLRNYFGDENVTVTAATLAAGQQITALLKATEMPRKSWLFRMKDGDARVLVFVPDGQITETGEVKFTKSGAIQWPATLTTYPDAEGVNAYFFFDDGRVLVASVPAITAVAADPEPGAAGQLATITGARFTGATDVKFGATSATDFTVVSPTTIVATIPAGSAGPVNVTVITPSGTSVAHSYTRG